MAPSLQSQDFTMGSTAKGGWASGSLTPEPGGATGGPGETQGSSLLFKMKPPKRPIRPLIGEDFGKARLKPDDAASAGNKYAVIPSACECIYSARFAIY